MGTVLAIGLLVAICGLIAYVGDLLGRRMGKRRLSLWGLRPRHTAILFTIGTGMLIAVFSLAVLMGLSVGIRRAVLQGEALLRENRALRQDNRARARERTELQAQILRQQEANDRLAEQERLLAVKAGRLEERLARRAARNQQLQADQRRLEARIEALDRTRRELEQRQREILARNERLREDHSVAQRQLVGARLQLRVVNRDLKETQEALLEARTAMRELTEQAGQQVERLRAREVELADERIIARANEELARIPLAPTGDRRAIRDAVESLMRRAEDEVRERHRSAGGTPPARILVWRTRTPQPAAPSDIVNTLVAWIAARGEPIVLRALADENAPAGSTVTMRLASAPRVLAFREGEEIAAATLDGSKSEGEVLRSLLAFLHGTVRQSALRRSVLPAGDGRVGEIPYDPLLATVKQIREVGGPARVSAVAPAEIRSEGPLRVDFRVVRWENRVAGDP